MRVNLLCGELARSAAGCTHDGSGSNGTAVAFLTPLPSIAGKLAVPTVAQHGYQRVEAFAGTPDWVLLLIGAIICTAVLGYLAFLLITSLTQALWGRILEPVSLAILIGTMWMRVFRSWRR